MDVQRVTVGIGPSGTIPGLALSIIPYNPLSEKLDAWMKRAELSLQDLAAHPVWVFRDAAVDETVEPHTKPGPVPLMALIATGFTAADGSTYKGFALHTKVSLVAPVILTAQGQVPLYLPNGRPTSEDLRLSYERLGVSPDQFFPVTITPTVKTRNKPVGDVWESFVYRDVSGMHSVA
ncbi:MAG TPA: hypothetical protein VMO47_00525 [Rhodothermales bacterium]|nr:hypothetical protein [Rhodothermales bacterium]